MNPKAVGELSEGMVLAHFLKKGTPVLLPFGNNQRYDLVVDECGVLVKAQVKTGRLADGCITFKTSSVNGFTGKRTSYAGAIDIFLVYCPETDAVYRVPVAETGASSMTLRVDPSRGGPKTTLKWARDYLA
jgi:hypothetical protein